MDQLAKQTITNQRRFSVIIAAYNIENYIERAIRSVANQTFKDIEIIVVNDCSTDHTEQIILGLCEQYQNIIYIKHEENKRLGAVRNTGLARATGEYIVFLDGDDYLADDTVLEKLDNLIGEDKTDVIYLGFEIEGNRTELVMPTEQTCTKTFKAAQDKYPNAWSKCWRKELLDNYQICFPEYRLYEDILFVYKAVMKANSFKMTDFVVHRYISGRPNSITTKITLRNVEDTVKNLKDLLEMRKLEPTEEIDIIIKKEIKMCKKRLDDAFQEIV